MTTIERIDKFSPKTAIPIQDARSDNRLSRFMDMKHIAVSLQPNCRSPFLSETNNGLRKVTGFTELDILAESVNKSTFGDSSLSALKDYVFAAEQHSLNKDLEHTSGLSGLAQVKDRLETDAISLKITPFRFAGENFLPRNGECTVEASTFMISQVLPTISEKTSLDPTPLLSAEGSFEPSTLTAPNMLPKANEEKQLVTHTYIWNSFLDPTPLRPDIDPATHLKEQKTEQQGDCFLNQQTKTMQRLEDLSNDIQGFENNTGPPTDKPLLDSGNYVIAFPDLEYAAMQDYFEDYIGKMADGSQDLNRKEEEIHAPLRMSSNLTYTESQNLTPTSLLQSRADNLNYSGDADMATLLQNVTGSDFFMTQLPDHPPEVTSTNPLSVPSLERLNRKLELSKESQETLQDWEYFKLGLPRSHSRTMMLSSQSRKRLQEKCIKKILSYASHTPFSGCKRRKLAV
jgi:hypothetical protein